DPDAVAAAGAPHVDDRAWSAAARLLSAGSGSRAWTGGWRLNGASSVRLSADTGGPTIARSIEPPRRRAVDDGSGPLSVRDGDTAFVSIAGRSVAFRFEAAPDLEAGAARAASGGGDVAGAEVHAPMPGLVVGVHVRA